jgi:hypothetical protein
VALSVMLCLGLSLRLGVGQTASLLAGTGSLQGSIVDAAGKPVAQARVAVRPITGGPGADTTSAADGTFALLDVPPGDYLVEVSTGTLSVAAKEALEVTAGATIALEAKLTGQGSGPGMLNIKAGGQLTEPLGVEPDQDDDGLMSLHGLPSAQDASTLDGVGASQNLGGVPMGTGRAEGENSAEDPDAAEQTSGPSYGLSRGRHAGVAYEYAAESVREFRLGTDGYSAQIGSIGAHSTTVTRVGGDKLHASLRLNLRSSVLAAKSPLAIATSYADGVVSGGEVKPHDLRENVSGSMSGPIPRLPKVHYLYAGDVQRRGFPAISSPANPGFYLLTGTQLALLANRGVSAAQISLGLNFLSSLTGETPRRADQTINFGRLDWLLGPRMSAGLEYNRVRWDSPAGLLNSPVVARGRASLGNAAGSVDQIVARLELARSSKTRAEVRLAYMRDLQYETPQTPLPQEAAIGPGGTSPEVNIGPDGLLFGTPASVSQLAYPDEGRVEAGLVVTVVLGRHLVQIGGSATSTSERVATLDNAAGTFRYDSGATGGKDGGLVDFLTDHAYSAQSYPNEACPKITAADHLFCFRSYTQSFGDTQVAFRTMDWSGFVEDSWRVGKRLRLNTGLRYEYMLLPLPQQPNAALDAVFGQHGATSVFPEDRNDLAPRVSATWEPFGRGKLLVKAGYGVFYGRLPGATVQAALSDTGQAASTVRIRLRPSSVANCPQVPAQGFGYLCSFTSEPTGVVAATTSAMVFDRRFRLPMVQQASVEVEREVRRGTTMTLGFVTNADRQLPTSIDLNIGPATGAATFQLQGGTARQGVLDGETFVVPRYTTRLTPSFGPVTDLRSSANAYYDALIVKVATRVARRLEVRANYTWSKAIDYGPNASARPRTNGQFDPYADGYDKGLSSLNYPQALHATATWTSEAEGLARRHRSRLGEVRSGWTLAAISTVRTGRPYSYDISGGTYLTGGHESINGSGGAQYLPTVGRNTLRLPMTQVTDARIGKEFRMARAVREALTAEVFNVFNHQSVSNVNQRAFLVGTAVNGVTPLVFQSAAEIGIEGLNTTAFGTPTGTGTSLNRERQVQFSARFSF